MPRKKYGLGVPRAVCLLFSNLSPFEENPYFFIFRPKINSKTRFNFDELYTEVVATWFMTAQIAEAILHEVLIIQRIKSWIFPQKMRGACGHWLETAIFPSRLQIMENTGVPTKELLSEYFWSTLTNIHTEPPLPVPLLIFYTYTRVACFYLYIYIHILNSFLFRILKTEKNIILSYLEIYVFYMYKCLFILFI